MTQRLRLFWGRAGQGGGAEGRLSPASASRRARDFLADLPVKRCNCVQVENDEFDVMD